jgi:hypothetical protein
VPDELTNPMNNITIEIAINVEPSGLPTWWRCCVGFVGLFPPIRLVFRRKSWVIAMPIEAKDRDVRSQARNVRSTTAKMR